MKGLDDMKVKLDVGAYITEKAHKTDDCSPNCGEFFESESVSKAAKAWNRRAGEFDG